jgi:hypothetical protein
MLKSSPPSGKDGIKWKNNLWKDRLPKNEIQKYQSIVNKRLTQECAFWLETGIMNYN